jgi:hypothetical protein
VAQVRQDAALRVRVLHLRGGRVCVCVSE